jgi:alpha-beta hydrolase superfamily lysophospholipase
MVDTEQDEVSVALARGPRRWREQRWLVDETIRSNGIEWDQPRLGYTLGPVVGEQSASDIAVLRSRIHKVADFVPTVSSVAARHEHLARQAEDEGHGATAGEHWHAAAMLWSLAVWPLWETTPELLALDERKNNAYLAWARHASHHVERVDVPFGDSTLPAWLHLPPSYDGRPLPTVLACGGMDAPREIVVAREGDAFLTRGFVVLAFDGPGQGESPIHGLYVTPTNWIDAGTALVSWCRSRPEVDAERLVCTGTSFGSFWITQMAATQPIFKGCAAALPIFEPGAKTIFEEASPTFKARHMFMAGLFHDEDAFDRLVEGYGLRPLISGMTVPWLVVGGEADELSPVRWVYEMARLCPAPSTLVIYQGARHALTESLAPGLGPPWRATIADWLLDRVNRIPMKDEFRYVTATGAVERRTHPRQS